MEQKKSFNKLFVLLPAALIVVAGIITYFVINSKPKDTFKMKDKGRYATVIAAARKKLKAEYGDGIDIEYENVIWEETSNHQQFAESGNSSDVEVSKYIVTFVMNDENKNHIQNYYCSYSKSQVVRLVEEYIKDGDSAIQNIVNIANNINKDRLRDPKSELKFNLKEIELNADVAGGVVGAGGKFGGFEVELDPSFFTNYIGDTVVTGAVTIEQLKKKLSGNDRMEMAKKIASLSEDEYYAVMIAVSSFLVNPKVSPISESRTYRILADRGDDEKYQELTKKYINKEISDVEDDVSSSDKYEAKLEELGIEKKARNGFSTASTQPLAIWNTDYKVSIPNYYYDQWCAQSRQAIFLSSYDEDKRETLLNIYITNSELSGNNNFDTDVEILKRDILNVVKDLLGDDQLDIYDYAREEEGKRWTFRFLTTNFYGENYIVRDNDTKQLICIMCLERINSKYEYKDDFQRIKDSINNLEKIAIGKSTEEFKKLKFREIKDYLEGEGFYNIFYDRTNENVGDKFLNAITNRVKDEQVTNIEIIDQSQNIFGQRQIEANQTFREDCIIKVYCKNLSKQVSQKSNIKDRRYFDANIDANSVIDYINDCKREIALGILNAAESSSTLEGATLDDATDDKEEELKTDINTTSTENKETDFSIEESKDSIDNTYSDIVESNVDNGKNEFVATTSEIIDLVNPNEVVVDSASVIVYENIQTFDETYSNANELSELDLETSINESVETFESTLSTENQ